jgi:arylsulfatase A-like enzyme
MWQVPAGYFLIFLPIALIALRPSPRSLSAIVLLCSFVSALALLPIVFKGMYSWAAVMLSAGIALQVVRAWRAHAWIGARLATTALLLTAIVLGLGVVFVARPIAAERRSIAELPAAPAGPNIVLIVLDTVRAKSLSLYGYERMTSPSLDRFAKKGLVFDRAYATAPWTLPSHASMFTGRYPHELFDSFIQPLGATYPTVAEVLGKRGYLTAGFVANEWYGGTEFGLARGFQHYEDTETSAFTLFNRTSLGNRFVKGFKIGERFAGHDNLGRKSAEEINTSFLNWRTHAEAGRPFFAFLNYCDAHAPYLPPEPFATKFTATRPFGHVGSRHLDTWTPDEVSKFRDAYDESIAYLDSELDALFGAIASTPRLSNTIVIITADHGEQFGEHRLLDHANSVYLPLLHVPLVIVGPGVPAGQRAAEPVSLRDVAATILEAAGVTGTPLPGQSLLSQAAASDTDNATLLVAEVERTVKDAFPWWYPAQRGRVKSLISRDWQYIRNFADGREELFDLRTDPFGLMDVAVREPARLNDYRLQMDALVKPSPRPR